MRAPTPFVLSLLLVLTGGVAFAGVSLDGLVTESPFVLKRAEGPATTAVVENATVEFRGMIATKDGVLFGFFDRTKNTSAWVKEHDKDSEFNVRGYDAANDTVALDYQGQKFALALSTAKISTAAPIVNAVARNGGQQGGGQGGGRRGGNGGTGGDNATKRPIDPQALESIAEKVRNQRAQRQAAAANGGGTGAAASTGGGQTADAASGTAAPARQGRSNRNR